MTSSYPLGGEVSLPEDVVKAKEAAAEEALYLHLTPHQINLLITFRLRAQEKILSQNYRMPEDDQASIRHRIFLDGEISAYEYLLDFDKKLAAELEAAKQAATDLQQTDTPVAPPTFDFHTL